MNKMYTRQGYLYAQSGRNGSMKALGGSGWTKYYCQYVAKTKTLTMIPYNQTTGKITSTETIRVGECAFKEKEDSGNKATATTPNTGGADKFKFVVMGEDMGEGVAGVSNFGIQKRGSGGAERELRTNVVDPSICVRSRTSLIWRTQISHSGPTNVGPNMSGSVSQFIQIRPLNRQE